jgi:glycosyltransferase involved in cell wall biosynthesis
MRRLVLFAPNVHVGGGLVLLKELLAASSLGEVVMFLDQRARHVLVLPPGQCHFVCPSVQSRFQAELDLYRTSREDDLIFCFHGLPPLLPVRGRVVVFQQNRILLGAVDLGSFPLRVRLRLRAEKAICHFLRHRVSEYVVQTPTMAAAVQAWYRGEPRVRVIPFVGAMSPLPATKGDSPAHEFVYIADGEAHKNHCNLVAAWGLLAKDGLFPTLALTLPERHQALWADIATVATRDGLRIRNLGVLPHCDVIALYQSALALVFPSTAESFGLPLYEAAMLGCPIIASELDYVRDVCVPVQSFDPSSPRSIAAAVKRFMNVPFVAPHLRDADQFFSELGR